MIMYVMAGLPYSGKTTFLNNLFSQEELESICMFSTNDRIETAAATLGRKYDECFDDFYPAARRAVKKARKEAFAKKQAIIHDQCNPNVRKRKSIVNLAKENGYSTICYAIVPPRTPAEWVEFNKRLDAGRKAGKTVPADVLKSMFDAWRMPTLREGFDTIVLIDTFGQVYHKSQNNS